MAIGKVHLGRHRRAHLAVGLGMSTCRHRTTFTLPFPALSPLCGECIASPQTPTPFAYVHSVRTVCPYPPAACAPPRVMGADWCWSR